MKNIARSAIVEHSAAEMYALVENIEAYPEFLPWCTAAQVHERLPGRTRATLTVGVGALSHAFTTLNDNRPGEAIDMHLVSGPFRRFEGRAIYLRIDLVIFLRLARLCRSEAYAAGDHIGHLACTEI